MDGQVPSVDELALSWTHRSVLGAGSVGVTPAS
jgi:hypothetical protein